jgi:RNA polymerase sigma-70 factor (ECF subfamily)
MRRTGVNNDSATGVDEHPRAVALQAFVEHDYRVVVGSVSLITGDFATAEDAVQDALVTAWRRRDQPIERLPAWVTVAASNSARSGHRRRSAERRALVRMGPPEDEETTTPVIDTDLLEALAGLPLRERQASVLFYVHDLSVVDVAAELGVAEGTVKTLLSRARSHLAEQLDADRSGGVA